MSSELITEFKLARQRKQYRWARSFLLFGPNLNICIAIFITYSYIKFCLSSADRQASPGLRERETSRVPSPTSKINTFFYAIHCLVDNDGISHVNNRGPAIPCFHLHLWSPSKHAHYCHCYQKGSGAATRGIESKQPTYYCIIVSVLTLAQIHPT